MSLRPLRPHQTAALDGLKASLMAGYEVWLPVVGFEGFYEVSDLGRVRSILRSVRKTPAKKAAYDHVVPARVMSASLRSGYPSVTLYREGVKTRHSVHRLVARAFIGSCPPGAFVCHCDGNPMNSHAVNLRYDTPRENSADMIRHGRSLVGKRNHLAKLDEAAVRQIRAQRGVQSQSQLARQFGVTKQAIGYVQRNVVWRHVHE